MFFALPNVTSNVVRLLPKPWEAPSAPDTAWFLPKERFRDWSADPNTEHTFISVVGGLDPLRRVADKDQNPPAEIHGFIADYDSDIPADRLNEAYLLTRKRGDFLPNFLSRSQGGGVHAVWIFEKPVRVAHADQAAVFLEHVAIRLKARNLYPNLGKESYDPFQYFELGRDWTPVAPNPISENHVWHWLYESGAKVKFTVDLSETVIPLSKVAERVEELYPGKWDGGSWELGVRGKAFWVADSTTQRCAIIREGGMQCFLPSELPFVPWSKILGRDWCEKFHADRIGAIIKQYWFDEDRRDFWKMDLSEDPIDVRSYTEKHLERELRLVYGISRKKLEGKDGTELEEVIRRVVQDKMVHQSTYRLYQPPGVMHVSDRKMLDIATVKVLPPAPKGEKPLKWGEGFPFIALMLEVMFGQPEYMKPTGKHPLEYFLGWLKCAYAYPLFLTPQPGQVLFLCGPKNIGKTVLVDKVIAPLLAGHGALAEPCQDYAFGHDGFNRNLALSPVWKIDDRIPSNSREHSAYSNFIKTTAADATLRVRMMRTNPEKTYWPGRLVVLMNLDPSSAMLLPNIEGSMLDKLNLFRCMENRKRLMFPSRKTGDRWFREQLPYLARWLIEWKIPKHLILTEFGGNARFGVETYHDLEVRRMAFQQGHAFGFFESLDVFLRNKQMEYQAAGNKATEWVGTAGLLSQEMSTLLGRSSDLNSNNVGRNLTRLEARGAGLYQEHTGARRLWHIPLDLKPISETDDHGGDRSTDQVIDAGVDNLESAILRAERDPEIPTSLVASPEEIQETYEREARELKEIEERKLAEAAAAQKKEDGDANSGN